MSTQSNKRASSGFTLIELMVTVAIVTILATIAVTSYSSQVQKSRRTEAKSALLDLAGREERLFSTSNAYSQDEAFLGYATVSTQMTNMTFGNRYYTLTAVVPPRPDPKPGRPAHPNLYFDGDTGGGEQPGSRHNMRVVLRQPARRADGERHRNGSELLGGLRANAESVTTEPRTVGLKCLKKNRARSAAFFTNVISILPSAVSAPFDARHHRPIIVRAILRNLARLFRRPCLAFGFVARLLLGTLAIFRVHENLTCYGTAGSGTRSGCARIAAGSRPGSGHIARTARIRHRRRIGSRVAVVVRIPRVINVVGVVVGNPAIPIGGVGQRQNGQEPRESITVVSTGPEAAMPVTAAPAGAAPPTRQPPPQEPPCQPVE